jgi:hypothetical protein
MTFGQNAGPISVGPIKAAPMSEIPCGKKDKSFSLVNTPGLTILSAIMFLLIRLYRKYKYHLKNSKYTRDSNFFICLV